MIVNIGIVAVIFGYSGWVLYRHVQKGKQGACAGCEKSKTCAAASADSPLSCCGPAASGLSTGGSSGRQTGM